MIRRAVTVLTLLLALAVDSRAQDAQDRLDFARSSARAQVALADDEALQPYRLSTSIEGGELVLRGAVPEVSLQARALEIARSHWPAGIRNEIQVSAGARRRPGPLPPPLRAQIRAPEEAAPPAQTETAPPQQPAEEFHVVQSGDTLFGLARRYGTSVSEIQRLNGMSGSNLRPGQRLRIR